MKEGNQIWGPYLALLKRDENLVKLHYKVSGHRVSPYLELQADDLYRNGSGRMEFSQLDVNPYIRFFSIFDPLLTPDNLGYDEFNQALSDVLLHYLADLDVKLGMCKWDFYIEFLVRDMERGTYGGLEELVFFTGEERRIAAGWLLCFYQTGDGIESILGAVKALLPACEVFIREGEEIVFHMREPQGEAAGKRLLFLIRLFLPLSFDYTVHWMETYGVIGYDRTMQQEGFLLA
jgi:hypothetical protein